MRKQKKFFTPISLFISLLLVITGLVGLIVVSLQIGIIIGMTEIKNISFSSSLILNISNYGFFIFGVMILILLAIFYFYKKYIMLIVFNLSNNFSVPNFVTDEEIKYAQKIVELNAPREDFEENGESENNEEVKNKTE